MTVFLDPEWQQHWAGRDPFAEAQALQGTVFRSKEGRRTLRFERGGKGYFLKWHGGIGWGEIFKNLLQLRLPVLGAENEYLACLRLKELGVDTMTPVAFARRGANPAAQQSFLITEELANTVSLEDVAKHWTTTPPSIREKRAVIRKLARISKTLHENGINHRDYYLCHFLRKDTGLPFVESDALFLIDLHRVQMRDAVPERWQVKDIAGLFYSAFDVPLTRRDIICFLCIYQPDWLERPTPVVVKNICHKACALYRKDFGREPPAALLSLLPADITS